MMLANLMAWQAPALAIVAWLATFVIHSTVLLAIAYLVQRRFAARPEIVDVVWKTAIVAALVSASVQTAIGVEPAGGRLSVATAPEPSERGAEAMPPAVRASGVVAPQGPAYHDVPQADGVLRTTAPTRVQSRDDDRDDDVGITARVAPPTAPSSPAQRDRSEPATPAAGVVPASTRVAESAPPSPPTDAPSSLDWAWLAIAWLAIAMAGGVGLARAWWRLRCALQSCVPAPAALTRMLAELQRDGAAVRLSLSPAITVPIATGVLAPHIVLPPRVLSLSYDAQRTMLAHELAHTRRRDPAWRLLLAVLERVLFVQPLLRVARANIEQSAEYLCDRWAAARTQTPLELARCLTEIASWVPTTRLGLAATLPEPQSILGRRVVRLLEPDADRSPRSQLWSLLAMSATGAALVVLAPTVSAAHEPAPAPTPAFDETLPMTFVHVHVPDASEAVPAIAALTLDDADDGTPRSTAKQRRSTRRQLRRTIAQARREHRDVELEALARALGHADAARARAAVQYQRALADLDRARAHAARARDDAAAAPARPAPPVHPAPPAPPVHPAPPAAPVHPAPPAWIEIDAPEPPAWIEIDVPAPPAWIEIDVPAPPAWIEIDAPEPPAWIEVVAPAPPRFAIDAPLPPSCPEPPDAPTPPSPPTWWLAPEAPPAPPAPPMRAARAPRPARRSATR